MSNSDRMEESGDGGREGRQNIWAKRLNRVRFRPLPSIRVSSTGRGPVFTQPLDECLIRAVRFINWNCDWSVTEPRQWEVSNQSRILFESNETQMKISPDAIQQKSFNDLFQLNPSSQREISIKTEHFLIFKSSFVPSIITSSNQTHFHVTVIKSSNSGPNPNWLHSKLKMNWAIKPRVIRFIQVLLHTIF